MQLSLTANGTQAISRNGDAIDWSQAKRGNLTIDKETITFEDWSIPATSIDEATLDTVRILHKKQQYLALSCGENRYFFTLKQPVEKSFNFSFDVLRTTKQSMPNKIMFGAAILFLVNILIIWVGIQLKG